MLRVFILASTACASASASNLVKRAPQNVPSFVIDYAPMVYLHSEDLYLPSDIGNQLCNTEPRVNFTPIPNAPNPLTLDNLADLSNLGGKDVYLTSNIRPNERPEYLRGVLPNDEGKTEGAVSAAIIVDDHGDKTVDAFYFYFYAFDYGGHYVNQDIGNHIGDWEHNMIRFVDGKPSELWYSQHSGGQAFEYGALEKYDGGLRVSLPCLSSSICRVIHVLTTQTTARRLQRKWLPRSLRNQRHPRLRNPKHQLTRRPHQRPHGERAALGPHPVSVLLFLQQRHQSLHSLQLRVSETP
jgi:hypothetical protein